MSLDKAFGFFEITLFIKFIDAVDKTFERTLLKETRKTWFSLTSLTKHS